MTDAPGSDAAAQTNVGPSAGSGKKRTIVVGGGFGGLAAAYELAISGTRDILVLEADSHLGGLAGTFDAGDVRLEKFYHHWFTNDRAAIGLVEEIGLGDRLLPKDSRTGMYYANQHYRLSKPTDLLKFKPLGWIDRFRLGWMTLAVRKIDDWKPLEKLTAREWLIQLAGQNVYDVVWEPLMRGKFGKYADDIAAVWMWNKLKLRGSSRGKGAKEQLVYIRGGFGAFFDGLADKLRSMDVEIRTGCPVDEVVIRDEQIEGVRLADGETIEADEVLMTQPHMHIRRLAPNLPTDVLDKLEAVPSLGNVCVTLFLKHSLSSTYWLNVNDPSFPFVAVIEHTNLDEAPDVYRGQHVVYLSAYVAQDDPRLKQDEQQIVRDTIPHLKRMFPDFSEDWIISGHAWKAQHAQPVVLKNYSDLLVPHKLPVKGAWLSTMSQIYPQDRGTNYAIAYGRDVARQMLRT